MRSLGLYDVVSLAARLGRFDLAAWYRWKKSQNSLIDDGELM